MWSYHEVAEQFVAAQVRMRLAQGDDQLVDNVRAEQIEPRNGDGGWFAERGYRDAD